MKQPDNTQDKLYIEVDEHFQKWSEDSDQRRNRKGGWNDITDAYWGKLPEKWPYISRITDPRIRTSIIEKDARLLNKKPKGKVIPRGGEANVVKAAVQNSLLSLQWDNATHGGTMQEKLIISSQDARLYASKFAYVYWKEDINKDGEVTFSGNEFMPLDIRDCGMDFKATHIRDAKWFQHRDWLFIDDMIEENKIAGKTIWKNMRKIKSEMKTDMKTNSDRRDNTRASRVKSIQGLTDRVGEDNALPVLEVITEYREDRWISFSPKYGMIIRDIKNPFKHGKIPISQLRYYPVQDDAFGESEIEPVLPLWRAIQATVCGYLDEMVLKMRPPLKIVENQVRIETIEYGPEAQWLMDSPDAVTEMRGNGEAQRWFETTYSALVSALNTAMGDLSQNTSSADMFNSEKTATEIKQTAKQQNARDQRNQNELNDFIKDVMLMWVSNNRQFMFSDPKKQKEVMKLVGSSQYEEFKKLGLADMVLPEESIDMMKGLIDLPDSDISREQLMDMGEAAQIPAYPYVENPNEKDISKLRVRPKLSIDEQTDSAELYITPQDFDGDYDFFVDVKSMEMGSGDEYVQSRQQALSLMKDPTIMGLLAQEGYRPKVRDLLVDTLNEGGLNDSQKYFEKAQPGGPLEGGQAPGVQGAGQVPGGPQQAPQVGGLPGVPTPQAPIGGQQ